MSHKYIRENKNSYVIVKSSRNYGKFDTIDDAVFIRDELESNNWNLDEIDEIYNLNDNYLVVKVIEDRVHILARCRTPPSSQTIEDLYKKRLRNPNNSKYGLNITRVFDTFVIKKRIAGDDYIFGYYDKLEDAEFVRNFLMDNDWDVTRFKEIEYDESEKYVAVDVIDDMVYVLESSQSEINIDNARQDFLNRISKHKLGLANHDYLGELTDKLSELEEKYGLKVQDDNWSLTDTANPLDDIIFKLTPFQQSVFDAVNHSTFDEIKQKLIRYKSKNFDKKIERNIEELMELGLVEKQGEFFEKRNV